MGKVGEERVLTTEIEGLQAASAKELSPASPNLVSSFPTNLQASLATPRIQPCLPTSSNSSLKSSYLCTEQSPWLQAAPRPEPGRNSRNCS